jgi:5-methylcytosine-specific restriction protein A
MVFTGQLACEVCAIDFKDAYGDLGVGYIECHHTVTLSMLREGQSTK